jgi:hypothetical protein
MSIGFDFPKDKEENIKPGCIEEKDGILYLKELELWEISLVTFPASIGARETRVKACDGDFSDFDTPTIYLPDLEEVRQAARLCQINTFTNVYCQMFCL